MRKSFGRAALILAAGMLLFSMADRVTAAPADDGAAVEGSADAGKPLVLTKSKKPRLHKASRSRKVAKVAATKPVKRSAPAKVAAQPAPPADIPDTVANANAQMPGSDVRGGAGATDITPAPLEAAAADQLTELDKSLAATPAEEPQQIAQLAQTSTEQATPAPEAPRPVTQARAVASTDTSKDPWAQSSLVGKIFIAFGGMLTLASAARMLIA